MKIDYLDSGAIAKLTITGLILEYRRHNRVLDAALLSANVAASRRIGLMVKSTITGKTPAVMRAYKAALRELNR
ncbi:MULTISPECIES: hypothetical protein [unclassified Serratia (in: enterobacteria)]|uniref:hypothetical protein n=1 Tax=unclassified Serratia (in: enterobacteria) TaxID=2647522 RepID=UPI000501F994|nr:MULTISPECIES: hypothetical protein [unclassified Serratia (in: enterobacteria)]KFK94283.1 hypothetical protein JV45_13340 [Serratia sp. Ag2]KFK98325.1 hypothetical protein IV04_13065 [Serratia sp. Ag1]